MSDVFRAREGDCDQAPGGPAEKVTREGQLHRRSGADSLDNVELVMAFEEEFGIEIPTTPPSTSKRWATR